MRTVESNATIERPDCAGRLRSKHSLHFSPAAKPQQPNEAQADAKASQEKSAKLAKRAKPFLRSYMLPPSPEGALQAETTAGKVRKHDKRKGRREGG